jgi:hypothetical protein
MIENSGLVAMVMTEIITYFWVPAKNFNLKTQERALS